ncbi:MAG: hypothetical protein H6834_17410, partial [Planctomycetes bacterium]|nr:hypothetical protein [Planctomycetota bacterium]
MSPRRAIVAWAVSLAACLAGCVTETTRADESASIKGSWQFEELTEGSRLEPSAPPTHIEPRAADPSKATQDPDESPGLNPELLRARATLLPRKRIRRPDGSEERFYAFEATLAGHYKALIHQWCKIYPAPGQPEVQFVLDNREEWEKARAQTRSILLREVDSPDILWSPKGGSTGEFGKLETNFGEANVNAPITKWLAARGNVEDLDALDGFIETFLIGVDQVEITARIVESAVSDVTDIGSLTKILPVNPKSLFQGLETNFPTVAPNSGILMLKGVHNNVDLETTLRILQQKSQVRFLATPRVTIRNGGSAALIKGDRVPIQAVTSITPAGALSTTVSYQPVGLALRL